MALQARKLGLSVGFLDLTHDLGNWSTEDFEGPFGIAGLESHPEWKSRLELDGQIIEQGGGICAWLADGPYEMKGPMANFYLERSTADIQNKRGPFNRRKADRRAQASASAHASTSGPVTTSLNAEPAFFAKYWLEYFNEIWGSTREMSFRRVIDWDKKSQRRIRQSFSFRQFNLSDYAKALEMLKQDGIQVSSHSVFKDVALKSHPESFFAIETTGEWVGLTKSLAAVWMLTSEETYFLSQSAGKTLYGQTGRDPESCWLRYEFTLKDVEYFNKFPDHFVFIGDPDLFWSRENYLIVQKAMSQHTWAIWAKAPFVQRFNSDYLKALGEKISAAINHRMGKVDFVQLKDYPREFRHTYKEIGPPRFPVYREDSVGRPRLAKMVIGSSPEQWSYYSWSDMAQVQNEDLEELAGWIRLRKEKDRDRTLHPS